MNLCYQNDSRFISDNIGLSNRCDNGLPSISPFSFGQVLVTVQFVNIKIIQSGNVHTVTYNMIRVPDGTAIQSMNTTIGATFVPDQDCSTPDKATFHLMIFVCGMHGTGKIQGNNYQNRPYRGKRLSAHTHAQKNR